MLLVSLRVDRRLVRTVCCALAAVALVCAAGVFFRLRAGEGQIAVIADGSGAVVKNYTAVSGEQRLAFIAQFGWEVEEEPVEIEEVVIPEEFDAVYERYNAIQKAQGLDLARFAGKKAKRYAYRVLNYPGCTDEIRLNLLCAQNKVIGGDVCSLALDGFMHGFKYEQAR